MPVKNVFTIVSSKRFRNQEIGEWAMGQSAKTKHHMGWLREHMRDRRGELNFTPAPANVLPFSTGSTRPIEGETVLDLVNEAAVMIMTIEARAVEIEMRAGDLIRETNQKLQFAEKQMQSLQTARQAAEQDMRDATTRAEQAEQACREAQSRAAIAEAELYAMERRVNAAEAQAEETKQALGRVEEAIRTKLLDLRHTGSAIVTALPSSRALSVALD
jgi:hypothetical protein